MALADPSFAPQHGAESALAVAGLASQDNEPFKGRLMDPIHVDLIRRRAVHAVICEGVRRKHMGKKIVQRGHRQATSKIQLTWHRLRLPGYIQQERPILQNAGFTLFRTDSVPAFGTAQAVLSCQAQLA